MKTGNCTVITSTKRNQNEGFWITSVKLNQIEDFQIIKVKLHLNRWINIQPLLHGLHYF